MKIAVYAIAKDEERHVDRWAESSAEADVRLVVDTGSSDATIARARSQGVKVHSREVYPWRFDTARNIALAMLPEDVDLCVTLDLDEVLLPGWRDALEALSPKTTRPRYRYIFSRNPDGSEAFTYAGHSAHARHGYRWSGAIHEIVGPDGVPEVEEWCEMTIEHKPDPGKSRGQYLEMLAAAVKDDPSSSRYAFYYGRELMFRGMNSEAVAELVRYLDLPASAPERATALRYLAAMVETGREAFLLRACAEAPERREPWVDLALHYYREGAWEGCLHASSRALAITERPLAYFCEPYAWGPIPHDLAALSCHHLGMGARAVEHGEAAVAIDPQDPRLSANLTYYRDGASA